MGGAPSGAPPYGAGHLEYFESVGMPVDDDTMMVLTRFDMAWDGR